MDIYTALVIFSLLFILLSVCVGIFAHYVKQVHALSALVERVVSVQENKKDTDDKIHALFHRRLTSQKTLLITLHNALEGAARGTTAEDTLKKLEVFADFVKPNPQRKS